MHQTADPESLYHTFHALKAERKLRNRDAAAALGVSEAEAIASGVGRDAVRLRAPFDALFVRLPEVGEVMALTRNEAAVHEKTGRFETMSGDAKVGLALGSAIDLRIFYSRWRFGYAVSEPDAEGIKRSLQFYDAQGNAVHKVFARAGTDVDAWARLVSDFTDDNQQAGERVEASTTAATSDEKPIETVDVDAFRRDWLAMQDTHDFFPLLRRHGVSRRQALALAPEGHAQRIDPSQLRPLLEQAAADGSSIMCFVGNPGMIQIHTGPVRRIEVMGPWLNVLDPGFNLHLRQDLVAQGWIVRKPTSDGIVTSIELLDADGETIAMFFGERKPGQPEREDWRALVAGVSDAPQPVAA
jgi:putative hemin transport protein